MRQTPLLILAYNRPDRVRGLIERLRPLAPQHLMVVVDGPKPGRPSDAERVKAVHSELEAIDWTTNVQTRLRPENVGLRRSVVDGVTWATSEYGQVVVIEEDVLVGPDFLPYIEFMLDQYRDEDRIAHISGYNVVPGAAMSNVRSHSRLTLYPESIAWATWDRAWAGYDDDLGWAMDASVSEIAAITGSTASALRWKQNFRDAHADRISTWAYRWIASMWSKGLLTLSPNHNLVTYAGENDGTNTLMKQRWKELPLFDGPVDALLVADAERDRIADEWVSRTVFGGTPAGVLKGTAISAALGLRKAQRQWKARGR